MRKLATVIALVLVSIFFACVFVGCSQQDNNEKDIFIFELNKDGQSYSVRANYNARQTEKEIIIPAEHDGKAVTSLT